MTPAQIRDALGRASHAHLVELLGPDAHIRPWHELSESGREFHRRREQWLVPTVEALIAVSEGES